MIMDSPFGSSVDGYQFSAGAVSPSPDEYFNYTTFFNDNSSSQPAGDQSTSSINNSPFMQYQIDTSSFQQPANFKSSASSDEAGSPDTEDSDDILRYISKVLMEESIDQNPCMFQDPLALQAAEKPFYDVLGEKYPSFSPNQHPLIDQNHNHSFSSSDERFFRSASDSTDSSHSGVDDSNWVSSLLVQTPPPATESPVAVFPSPPAQSSSSTTTSSTFAGRGSGHFVDSNYPSSSVLSSNIFSDRDSMLLFQKGVEEANKFLPKQVNLFDFNLDNIMSFPEKPTDEDSMHMNYLPPSAGSRTRKALHYLEDGDNDLDHGQRKSKQAALSVEETDELSELFDKVLLCNKEADCLATNPNPPNPSGLIAAQTQSENHQPADKNRPHHNKQINSGSEKKTIDLRTMLILCAQAAASDDLRTANELLRQIRQHSSPTGTDGSQRLAHYFSNAIEARLAGSGSQIYTALASKRTAASDVIRAYQLFVSCCPFKRMSIILANKTILQVAAENEKNNADKKTIHVIDFGIRYGFQWPSFIQCLSQREGGPPSLLKITGIELPQPGFRPAERVEMTGDRLTKYCEKFNVKFKYRAIAQKWETIRVEDLGIEEDEVVIVNSLFRLRNLLDETIVVKNNPRDAVLRLIREIRPAVFMHGSVNGSFNAPFFLTRFREALFHYSTLFDLLETNVTGGEEDEAAREVFEKEFYGRDIMNVVACEGTERVERPETYKQWGVRIGRAGFRQVGFDQVVMEMLKLKVRSCYHKDFVTSGDGYWALQGWKGRSLFALSAWMPT